MVVVLGPVEALPCYIHTYIHTPQHLVQLTALPYKGCPRPDQRSKLVAKPMLIINKRDTY
jgi:hypothetical protein